MQLLDTNVFTNQNIILLYYHYHFIRHSNQTIYFKLASYNKIHKNYLSYLNLKNQRVIIKYSHIIDITI